MIKMSSFSCSIKATVEKLWGISFSDFYVFAYTALRVIDLLPVHIL